MPTAVNGVVTPRPVTVSFKNSRPGGCVPAACGEDGPRQDRAAAGTESRRL